MRVPGDRVCIVVGVPGGVELEGAGTVSTLTTLAKPHLNNIANSCGPENLASSRNASLPAPFPLHTIPTNLSINLFTLPASKSIASALNTKGVDTSSVSLTTEISVSRCVRERDRFGYGERWPPVLVFPLLLEAACEPAALVSKNCPLASVFSRDEGPDSVCGW